MTPTRALTMILVAAACTFATRVAPFLLFNGKKPIHVRCSRHNRSGMQ